MEIYTRDDFLMTQKGSDNGSSKKAAKRYGPRYLYMLTNLLNLILPYQLTIASQRGTLSIVCRNARR